MERPRWLVGYLFIFIYFLGCVEAVRYARSRASQNNEEQCRRVPRTKQDRGERVCFPRETRVLSFAGMMTRRRGNRRFEPRPRRFPLRRRLMRRGGRLTPSHPSSHP